VRIIEAHLIYSKFAGRNLHLLALFRKKVVENSGVGAYSKKVMENSVATISGAELSLSWREKQKAGPSASLRMTGKRGWSARNTRAL
jgi:hypothetical protein